MIIDAAGERSEQGRFLSKSPVSRNAGLGGGSEVASLSNRLEKSDLNTGPFRWYAFRRSRTSRLSSLDATISIVFSDRPWTTVYGPFFDESEAVADLRDGLSEPLVRR